MSSTSKRRGKYLESKIADAFTEWHGENFKKIPNSGALRWQGSSASGTFGDLLTPKGFLGIIECKIRHWVDIEHILRNPPEFSEMMDWWDQVNSDVVRCLQETKAKLAPLLVFQRDRTPPMLCIEWKLLREFEGLLSNAVYFIMAVPERPPIAVVKLDNFFKFVTVKEFNDSVRATR